MIGPRDALRRLAVAALGLALLVAPAGATWSIVVVDTSTGEMAVAGATCLGYVQLKNTLAVVYNDVGVAAAQASVDSTGTNRQIIYDGFMQGLSPAEILDLLAQTDPGHYSRQYGIVDLTHDPLTYTGVGCQDAATGVAKIAGNLRYAIQGNVLTGNRVVEAAERALLETQGDLSQKVMAAMEAARSLGGDGRCSCAFTNPTGCGCPPPSFSSSAHVSFFVLTRKGDTLGTCSGGSGCANGSYYLDLNFTQGYTGPDPVLVLQRKYHLWRDGQVGRPDQLASQVRAHATQLPSDGTSATRVGIGLFDLDGHPVVDPGLNLWLTYVGSGTPHTTPSSIHPLGNNRWGFALRAGTTPGVDRWQVWVDDGQGPVLLQPDVEIEVLP